MPQLVSTQIKLRRAFRYGYFAFLAGIGLALTLLIVRFLGRDAVAMLSVSLSDKSFWLMLALVVLGLCVPLFFASWLLVAKAILGSHVQRPRLMEGIPD